jgi:beta-N-acetylhexosaminidase
MTTIELTSRQLSGQLIVGGFSGIEMPAEYSTALRAGERGGAILFTRNLPSLAVAQALCRSISEAAPASLPPFIGVDEEGGQVSRLPAPRLPPMRELGRIGDADLVERAGHAVGRLLAETGFSIDFAPVLDVDSNRDNPVIADRSFSRDPEVVAALGAAMARGLQSAGVMACGKHFPGHGDTSQDSHLDLPTVGHDTDRLQDVEIHPFRELARTDLAAMMTAHVIFTRLDAAMPATLSRRILTNLLRTDLRFEGVLFSDGMEMRALSDRLPIEQSSVRAIEAGCDALLICHDLDLQERAHAALLAKVDSDSTFRERCSAAAARSLAWRRRFPPRPALDISAGALEEIGAVVGEIRLRGGGA